MKRDMEIVRQILLQLEERSHNEGTGVIKIQNVDDQAISYHVGLLAQAGYVEAMEIGGEGPYWHTERLTWAGHEFLDAARNDSVWKSVMGKVKASGVSFTVEVINFALMFEGRRLGHQYLGLPFP